MDNLDSEYNSSVLGQIPEEEDSLDSGDNSIDGISGGSPLSRLLLQKSREMSPKRQMVEKKREALLGAYKNLIAAQRTKQYNGKELGNFMGGVAAMKHSINPSALAYADMLQGNLQGDMMATEAANKSAKEQAVTNLQMNNADMGFTDQDEKQSLSLLGKAGDLDARDNAMQMRIMLAKIRAGANSPAAPAVATPDPASAAAVGVPLYDGPNPYDGLDKVGARQQRMNYEKKLLKMQDATEDASKDISQMDTFLNLNEKLNENAKKSIVGYGGTGGVSGSIPFRGKFDDDFATMDSIAAEIIPRMRTPGSGSTSDFDAKMFAKGTVGADKLYQTNKNIGMAYKMNKQNELDKADFFENYLSVNGHLRGAQKQWQNYLNSNPIFKNDKFDLNENRKSWSQYFGKTSEDGDDLVAPSTKTTADPVSVNEWDQHGFTEKQWKRLSKEQQDELNRLKAGE